MNRLQEDSSARKFDCELPANVRTEILQPAPKRIFSPPEPPEPPFKPSGDPGRAWSHPVVLVLFFVLAFLVLAHLSGKKTVNVVPTSPVTVQPTPAPTPVPVVPRASLVPVPVRRATLNRLPAQEIGVYKAYQLPLEWGGGSILARFLGTKEHFSEIPSNPSLGDMWNVTETGNAWIYTIPAGYAHAAWIDP